MMDADVRQHRSILQRIAHRAMLERGLSPVFAPQALAELDRIQGPATRTSDHGSAESTRDLRNLLWCSIDNDDSRDLDQLTVAEAMPDGTTKVLVAIADVDAVVRNKSALDDHARQNTTSVYTVAETFPMLPEKLSTDLTSLNYGAERLAVVIEDERRVAGEQTAAVKDGSRGSLCHRPFDPAVYQCGDTCDHLRKHRSSDGCGDVPRPPFGMEPVLVAAQSPEIVETFAVLEDE
jgi:exoribonuclease II